MVARKAGFQLWLCVIALFGAATALAEVSVRVDRNPVHVDETFRITYQADFRFSGRPDLTPLAQVLDILGTSQRTNLSIINGRQELVQSLILDVTAKTEGPLTIPSLEFDNQHSEALTINVLSAAAGTATANGEENDIFLESRIEPDEGYVQSQYIFTLRVFHDVGINNATLTEPSLSGADAVIEKLGEDAYFKTQRNGRSYTVVERRYAIFPQSSGPLAIEPMLFEATVGGNRRSLLDLYGGRGERVRLRTERVEADVQPIPADFPGSQWLPARRVYLQEDWSGATGDLPVGEPVTRTVRLVAEGLRASQLPEISPPASDGIKQYPDQPVLSDRAGTTGMTGIREEKVALIPSTPGEYEIPEIELPWFNTQTGQVEYARLPARQIMVTGALPEPDARVAAGPVAGGIEGGETSERDTVQAATPDPQLGRWRWLSLGLAIAWLLTIAAWWRSRRSTSENDAGSKTVRPPSSKAVRAALKSACLANDKTATRDALLRWSALRWPGNAASSLGEIGSRLSGDLQVEVHGLSRAIYQSGDTTWRGDPLWTTFAAQEKPPASIARRDPEPRLAPLYRIP